METFAEREKRSDWYKLRSVEVFDLRHFLSAAMFTEIIGQPGAEGAGLDERGQKLSKQDVRVEQRVSVAVLVSSAEYVLYTY